MRPRLRIKGNHLGIEVSVRLSDSVWWEPGPETTERKMNHILEMPKSTPNVVDCRKSDFDI